MSNEILHLDSPVHVPVGPPQLAGDPRRQAVDSILGVVYQAWASIEAWLRLTRADEVIYLEGAEDFDVVRTGEGIAVQVKHRDDPISLGTKAARTALENFWKLARSDPTRRIDVHYLTTSRIASERGASFEGLAGIDAWRAARTSEQLATEIVRYLVQELSEASTLATFLKDSAIAVVQEQLFDRFHWLTEQPDLASLKRSVLDRISIRLQDMGRSPSLRERVQVALESRFWDLIVQQESSSRRLTLGDLIFVIETATTAYMPVPIDRIPDLLGGQSFGPSLLNLLREQPTQAPVSWSNLFGHLDKGF